MTEEKFSGWKSEPAQAELEKGKGKVDCQRIISRGGAPILVRKIEGAVTLKRPDAAALTVTALDANGYAIGKSQRGVAPLKLKPDCFYYVITKAN